MNAAQNAPAPDAAEPPPAYAIIKQKKSRWWEVRDPTGELVRYVVSRASLGASRNGRRRRAWTRRASAARANPATGA